MQRLLSDWCCLNRQLPRWLSVRGCTGQCRRHRRLGFDPWIRKISWWRAWQLSPGILPGEGHGQRSLAGYCPWGRQESDTTEQLSTPVSQSDIFSFFLSFSYVPLIHVFPIPVYWHWLNIVMRWLFPMCKEHSRNEAGPHEVSRHKSLSVSPSPMGRFKELLIREGRGGREKERAVRKHKCSLGAGLGFLIRDTHSNIFELFSRTITSNKWKMLAIWCITPHSRESHISPITTWDQVVSSTRSYFKGHAFVLTASRRFHGWHLLIGFKGSPFQVSLFINMCASVLLGPKYTW